jgi:hypothetical protein
VLSSKHWAGPASAPVNLELVTTNTHTNHLEVVSELAGGTTKLGADCGQRGIEDRVLGLLGQGATMTRAKRRDSLGVKNERLGVAPDPLRQARGRYHVDKISARPLPSEHSSCRWSVGIKRPDGSVVLERGPRAA